MKDQELFYYLEIIIERVWLLKTTDPLNVIWTLENTERPFLNFTISQKEKSQPYFHPIFRTDEKTWHDSEIRSKILLQIQEFSGSTITVQDKTSTNVSRARLDASLLKKILDSKESILFNMDLLSSENLLAGHIYLRFRLFSHSIDTRDALPTLSISDRVESALIKTKSEDIPAEVTYNTTNSSCNIYIQVHRALAEFPNPPVLYCPSLLENQHIATQTSSNQMRFQVHQIQAVNELKLTQLSREGILIDLFSNRVKVGYVHINMMLTIRQFLRQRDVLTDKRGAFQIVSTSSRLSGNSVHSRPTFLGTLECVIALSCNAKLIEELYLQEKRKTEIFELLSRPRVPREIENSGFSYQDDYYDCRRLEACTDTNLSNDSVSVIIQRCISRLDEIHSLYSSKVRQEIPKNDTPKDDQDSSRVEYSSAIGIEQLLPAIKNTDSNPDIGENMLDKMCPIHEQEKQIDLNAVQHTNNSSLTSFGNTIALHVQLHSMLHLNCICQNCDNPIVHVQSRLMGEDFSTIETLHGNWNVTLSSVIKPDSHLEEESILLNIEHLCPEKDSRDAAIWIGKVVVSLKYLLYGLDVSGWYHVQRDDKPVGQIRLNITTEENVSAFFSYHKMNQTDSLETSSIPDGSHSDILNVENVSNEISIDEEEINTKKDNQDSNTSTSTMSEANNHENKENIYWSKADSDLTIPPNDVLRESRRFFLPQMSPNDSYLIL